MKRKAPKIAFCALRIWSAFFLIPSSEAYWIWLIHLGVTASSRSNTLDLPASCVTAPPSPQTKAAISLRASAASCPSRPPSPTIFTSRSGSHPCCLANMRAKTHVVAPTRVTPIVLPFKSAAAATSGATLRVKWLPSVCVATIFNGCPASRATRMSVLPAAPRRSSPATTAFTRSGPPRKGTNSAASPSILNKPFASATMNGPASA